MEQKPCHGVAETLPAPEASRSPRQAPRAGLGTGGPTAGPGSRSPPPQGGDSVARFPRGQLASVTGPAVCGGRRPAPCPVAAEPSVCSFR